MKKELFAKLLPHISKGWQWKTKPPRDERKRIIDVIAQAVEFGWGGAAEGRTTVALAALQPLTGMQKRLLGAGEPPTTAFGGRFAVFPQGTIAIASSWTRYNEYVGYVGHICRLYAVPGTDGHAHAAAWCFNWNFPCELGLRTRQALENGNIDDLPALTVDLPPGV